MSPGNGLHADAEAPKDDRGQPCLSSSITNERRVGVDQSCADFVDFIGDHPQQECVEGHAVLYRGLPGWMPHIAWPFKDVLTQGSSVGVGPSAGSRGELIRLA